MNAYSNYFSFDNYCKFIEADYKQFNEKSLLYAFQDFMLFQHRVNTIREPSLKIKNY